MEGEPELSDYGSEVIAYGTYADPSCEVPVHYLIRKLNECRQTSSGARAVAAAEFLVSLRFVRIHRKLNDCLFMFRFYYCCFCCLLLLSCVCCANVCVCVLMLRVAVVFNAVRLRLICCSLLLRFFLR